MFVAELSDSSVEPSSRKYNLRSSSAGMDDDALSLEDLDSNLAAKTRSSRFVSLSKPKFLVPVQFVFHRFVQPIFQQNLARSQILKAKIASLLHNLQHEISFQ